MRILCCLLLAVPFTSSATFAGQQPTAHIQAPPPLAPETDTPEPDKPIRVSGTVEAGNIISRIPPVYPPTDVQGIVVLHAIIAPDGTVRNVSVVSGHPALQNAALAAVRQWRYQPYLLNGRPVAVDTTVLVNFKR